MFKLRTLFPEHRDNNPRPTILRPIPPDTLFQTAYLLCHNKPIQTLLPALETSEFSPNCKYRDSTSNLPLRPTTPCFAVDRNESERGRKRGKERIGRKRAASVVAIAA